MSIDPITRADAWLCDLAVEVPRTDSMQTFLKQETVFVQLQTASGVTGLGYSYTIGTGGRAVLSLLREAFLPAIIGLDVHCAETIWQTAYGSSRATAVGAINSLALAALDVAVWDARGRATGLPLWKLAGGAKPSIAVYDTEGGWMHFSDAELADNAQRAVEQGMGGVKIKVGAPRLIDDVRRLEAVREAVGTDFDIMIDANQSLTAAEAIRRADAFSDLDIFWFEEPLPADDVAGHERLAAATPIPIAVGESMYSIGHFKEYLHRGAAAIVQADVARVGGVTPWLKVAHLAEAYGATVAPHFLMELHLPLVCAVSNSIYLEHIPQLRRITTTEVAVVEGRMWASDAPGLGIEWDADAMTSLRVDA